jgi:dynein heavy chain
LQAPLDSIDPENLNASTLKYGKSVYQLEKGLPPNGVVPLLKERVESMKEKLPVITHLRNPSLKSRHWDVIETVLNYHFDAEDPLSLGRLVQLDAFKHTEAIEETSAQASSEASLESILRKVSIWHQAVVQVSQHNSRRVVVPRSCTGLTTQ